MISSEVKSPHVFMTLVELALLTTRRRTRRAYISARQTTCNIFQRLGL